MSHKHLRSTTGALVYLALKVYGTMGRSPNKVDFPSIFNSFTTEHTQNAKTEGCVITDLYRDVMRSAQSEIVYSRYKYIWLLGLPSERHDFPDALCVFVEINLRSASTSRRASSSIWKLYSVVYRSVFRNGGLCITYVLHFFQINGLCSSSIHIVEEEGICVCIALWKCITL